MFVSPEEVSPKSISSSLGKACVLMHAEISGLVMRDVKERGRDIDGCIKQWMAFVKPNFSKYVEPQRGVAGEQCILDLEQYALGLINGSRYHSPTWYA